MSSDLLGIPPTHLPDDPARRPLDDGVAPDQVAAAHPDVLARLGGARRGRPRRRPRSSRPTPTPAPATTAALDALRRSGWRGQGPVPWEHEPNRGFLRRARMRERW